MLQSADICVTFMLHFFLLYLIQNTLFRADTAAINFNFAHRPDVFPENYFPFMPSNLPMEDHSKEWNIANGYRRGDAAGRNPVSSNPWILSVAEP